MSGKRRSRSKTSSNETTRDKLLKWNEYYSSGSFGIGIECTSCKKWRQVYEYVEGHEVPEDWVCSMSVIDGQQGSCDLPAKYNSDYFVGDTYIPGSIVWAKCPTFPWWPAMVEDDPDTEEYRDMGKTEDDEEYHVVFFYETASRRWINVKNITPFVKPPPNMKMSKVKPNMKKRLENAVNKGKLAVTMSIAERLKNFSFAVFSGAKFPKSKTNRDVPKVPVQPKRKNDRDVPKVPVQPKRKNDRDVPKVPVQPKRKNERIPKYPSSTKRKKEVKATANRNLPIKKRKTFTAYVPQTSQTPNFTDVTSFCITPSDSNVTSLSTVPLNPSSPQSPATAENPCQIVPVQEAISQYLLEQNGPGTISNCTNAEDPLQNTSGMFKSDTEVDSVSECASVFDDSNVPSPYSIIEKIKEKTIDELFSDIDSDDLYEMDTENEGSLQMPTHVYEIETGNDRFLQIPTPEIEENFIITESGEILKCIDDTPEEGYEIMEASTSENVNKICLDNETHKNEVATDNACIQNVNWECNDRESF